MSYVSGMQSFGPSDSLAIGIMLESTKRSNLAEKRLRQFDNWTWNDFETYVTWVPWEDDKQLFFFYIEQRAREQNPSCIPKDVIIMNGPPLIVQLRLATQATFKMVDHLGGISGLGSILPEADEGMRTFRLYNPTILTANYQRQGNIGRFNGELDSGKTNGACVQMEQWLKEDINHIAIANIKMFGPIERYIYATKASVLLRTLATMEPKQIAIFDMDEGGLNYSKPDQITTRVRQIDKLMRLIRKLHCSFNLIEQREESVPNLIKEWARNIFKFEKGNSHVVHIELRGPELAFRDTVKAFPKTSLPFDTDDPALFDFDIDIEELHEKVSGKDDMKAAILGYLDNLSIEKGETPRKCGFPGCDIEFLSSDKRRIYCDSHKTLNASKRYEKVNMAHTTYQELPPKDLDRFIHDS